MAGGGGQLRLPRTFRGTVFGGGPSMTPQRLRHNDSLISFIGGILGQRALNFYSRIHTASFSKDFCLPLERQRYSLDHQ